MTPTPPTPTSKPICSEKDFKAYGTIKTFVHEMNELYGSAYKPLAVYNRLLEKTADHHEEAIRKHVQAFRKFVVANRNSVLTKDERDMTVQKIKYSDKVFLNVAVVLKMAAGDEHTQLAIWEYLLALSAILDANSGAKRQIQSRECDIVPAAGGGDAMLSTIMGLVSNSLLGGTDGNSADTSGLMSTILGGLAAGNGENGADIGSMVGQLTSSGVMSRIMAILTSNIEDGKLDVRNLLVSLQALAAESKIQLPPISVDPVQGDGDGDNASANMDSVLSMFEGMGIDRSEMQKMVETMETLVAPPPPSASPS